ncbi:tryptophan synthase subunit alpha [Candidatus Peregrinibacteria bacterium]|nr:tryptophan synthase subunit alpha [Candidatus Peregrinibacteria bacterium]
MTHIVAGYPNMKECEERAIQFARSGIEFVEIQIPFSDPVADGPVIMKACEHSLKAGTKTKDCFNLMKRLSKRFKEEKLETKLLFMTYFNISHKYGLKKFCKDAKQVGAYGLIIPDIPIDEESHEGYLKECKANDLNPIQVISPITPDERLNKIGKVAKGFVYCVSRYGTTGAKSDLNPKLKTYLGKVRKYIDLPLAVGFGISNRAQINAVHKHAEIAVIGSALIESSSQQSINLFSVGFDVEEDF